MYSGRWARPELAIHFATKPMQLPAGADQEGTAEDQHDADYHGKRGQARTGPGEDHDTGEQVKDRDGDVAAPTFGLADGGNEAHHAGHDEPHAEDQHEDDERVERFLDQHQTSDCAEHTDKGEQAAAITPAKDRGDDGEEAIDE